MLSAVPRGGNAIDLYAPGTVPKHVYSSVMTYRTGYVLVTVLKSFAHLKLIKVTEYELWGIGR